MKRAVIYARYSSSNQKEESIEQQIAECRDYAERHDIEIVREYRDEAISGKTDKRPSFQRLMRDVEHADFDTVIAYKSSRISRNMLNALQYEEKLSKKGIDTIYAREEFGDSAAGRFALRTMMSVNAFYSDNLSEDIKRGMNDNASKCKVVTRPPFGYKSVDGYYAVDEDKAPYVKYIFESVASGASYVSVLDYLNEHGVRTALGNQFNKNSFHRLLANEIYCGVYNHCGNRVEDAVPPIISRELFDKVQTNTHAYTRKTAHGEYLLSGKLYCGLCGDKMVGTGAKTKNGTPSYFYYTCRTSREHKCEMKPCQRDWLEEYVTQIVSEYALTDEIIEKMADSVMEYQKNVKSNAPALTAEKAEKEKALQNCISAIEQGLMSESVQNRIVELETDIADLSQKILKENRTMIRREDFVAALKYYAGGDYKDKDYQKLIIGSFVKRVTLFGDRLEIDFNSGIKDGSYKHPLPPPYDVYPNYVVLGNVIRITVPIKKGRP